MQEGDNIYYDALMYIKVDICKLTIDYQYIECLTFARNFENLNLHWIWLDYKCYVYTYRSMYVSILLDYI